MPVKRHPFKLGEREFDLSHLGTFELEYIVPAKGEKPEQRYFINVDFSMHCFTKEFTGKG